MVNDVCECLVGVTLSDGTCYLNPDPCVNKPYMFSTDGSCTDSCGTGFYLDNLNSMCRPCNTGCTTCTDFTACVTCGSGFTLNGLTGECYCDHDSGKYLDTIYCTVLCSEGKYKDDTTKRCEVCPKYCKVCS